MNNVFIDMPEFIDSDIRISRNDNKLTGSYKITNELQYFRHDRGLPDLAGLSVLDLGCCVAATGAWALSTGASSYVGVEIQATFAQQSRKNLAQYFPDGNWQIIEESFDEFFNSNSKTFDVVIAWGVIYQAIHIETLINRIAKICRGTLVVDSISPYSSLDIPYIEYKSDYKPFTPGESYSITAAMPNKSALLLLLQEHNFKLTTDLTNELQRISPEGYQQRYFLIFEHNKLQDLVIPDTWQFDSSVADNFATHARKHIPKYDEVITQSIELCEYLAKKDSKIIDVGCAVGETVKRLHRRGFTNLVGVDYSENMLAHAKQFESAKWIYSSAFPAAAGPFQVVLCNWTLHFIKDKTSYLTDIYNSIDHDGALIVTDKTSLVKLDIELYHEFKRRQGVSEEEIHRKAQSVKDIMYIDSPEWYLSTLQSLGFKHVSIINAAPCFTTFLAIK